MDRIDGKKLHVSANKGLYLAASTWALAIAALLYVRAQPAVGHELWTWAAFCSFLSALLFIYPKQIMILFQVAFAILLFVVFVQNTFLERGEMAWPILLSTLLAIGLYGCAEGFEIAFTNLSSKEQDRFDEITRNLLTDLKARWHLFYESREWLVIMLVIGLTLASDFHALYLWFWSPNPIDHRPATVAFSLLFTTVMAVWVAQSPGKALAKENPVRFLRLCRPLWTPLRLFGEILKNFQIFEPASLIKGLLTRLFPSYRNPPALVPSQEALYHTALKRYGYSLHGLEDQVTIYPDGTATLKQTGLFYVVSGERQEFERWYTFDAPILATASNTPDVMCELVAYHVDSFTDEIAESLNEHLRTILTGEIRETPADLGLRYKVAYGRNENGTENRQKVSVIVESPNALPEETDFPNRAIAIRFQVQLRLERQGFKMPDPLNPQKVADRYFRTFSFPCRYCKIKIEITGQSGTTQFANVRRSAYLNDLTQTRHPNERNRVNAHTTQGNKQIVFWTEIPLPGVKYQIDWEVWP